MKKTRKKIASKCGKGKKAKKFIEKAKKCHKKKGKACKKAHKLIEDGCKKAKRKFLEFGDEKAKKKVASKCGKGKKTKHFIEKAKKCHKKKGKACKKAHKLIEKKGKKHGKGCRKHHHKKAKQYFLEGDMEKARTHAKKARKC